MERLNQLDFDPLIITKKDVAVIATGLAALAALAAFGSWKTYRAIKNRNK